MGAGTPSHSSRLRHAWPRSMPAAGASRRARGACLAHEAGRAGPIHQVEHGEVRPAAAPPGTGDSSALVPMGVALTTRSASARLVRQPRPRAVRRVRRARASPPSRSSASSTARAAPPPPSSTDAAEAVRPQRTQLVHERRQVGVVADQPPVVADHAVDRVRRAASGEMLVHQVRDRGLVGRGHVGAAGVRRAQRARPRPAGPPGATSRMLIAYAAGPAPRTRRPSSRATRSS